MSRRQIRVFISSTFRDMQLERDELFGRVFPEIRYVCKQRNVDFVEVDLRWGITEDQTRKGEVIPICLREVERCRPYFIGILGERYGWVPPPEELGRVKGYAWLADHPGISVTEMEILHGVLLDPAMRHHAFFFYRDPAWLENVPEDERHVYLAPPEDRPLQAALKQRIRDAGFPVSEFPTPHTLGEQVRDTLLALVDDLYPVADTPDWLTIEQIAQDAFQSSRAAVYVERPALFDALDGAALGDDARPLVITGPSGSGKSALIANWAQRFLSHHADAPGFFLLHFIGGTPHSAHPFVLLYRIVGALQRYLGTGEIPPQDYDALTDALPRYLERAAERGPVILALDALDQLEDVAGARRLEWLPQPLPEGLRLILSTLPGDTLDALERRGLTERALPVPDLEPDERADIIRATLSRYRKALNERRVHTLAHAPQTANPLYLRTLLEELRVFGQHERLDARIDGLLAAPDLPALFDGVLARLEDELERPRPHLVRDTLSALWAARRGLTEPELLDATGVAPLHWAPLFMALEPSLVDRSGQLSFFHAHLRRAVARRYLDTDEAQARARRGLADAFLRRTPDDPRRADELPRLLDLLGDHARLRDVLCEHATLSALLAPDRQYELLGYWLRLEASDHPEGPFDRAEALAQALEARADLEPLERAEHHHEIARFMHLSSRHADAARHDRAALELREAALPEDDARVSSSLNNLGVALVKLARSDEAEPLLRRALEIDTRRLPEGDPQLAVAARNLASVLEDTRRFEDADALLLRAIGIAREAFGEEHAETLSYVRARAGLLYSQERDEEAEALYRDLLERATRLLGPDHPEVGNAMNGLANVLVRQERGEEALPLLRRALEISEQTFGPAHEETLVSLNNLAAALSGRGAWDEALELFQRAIQHALQQLPREHPRVVNFHIPYADLLRDLGRFDEAEPIMQDNLRATRERWGEEHLLVGLRLFELAKLYEAAERFDEARPLFRELVYRAERAHGHRSDAHATALNNLAYLLYLDQRFMEAEDTFRQALRILEQLEGRDSDSVAGLLDNLARTLRADGRPMEAAPLYEEALASLTSRHGEAHPDVARLHHNYGYLLASIGRLEEAEAHYDAAVTAREAVLWPGHPSTLLSLAQLGEVREALGRFELAAQAYFKRYSLLRERVGALHHDTIITMNNIARCCQNVGAVQQAHAYFLGAHDLLAQLVPDPAHPERMALAGNVAQAEMGLGQFDQAVPRLRALLELQRQALGEGYEAIGVTLYLLGHALVGAGQPEEGLATLERELGLCEATHGPEHEHTRASRQNLAQVRAGLDAQS